MDINIRELLPLDAEKLKRLKKWLEEEEKRGGIRDLEEKDFGNDVSYIKYDDEDGSKRIILFNKEFTYHIKLPKNGALSNWKRRITKDGEEIITNPSDIDNVLKVAWSKYDISNFHSEAGFIERGEGYEVKFVISGGEVLIEGIVGNPENKVFFKNGNQLQTIDKNGNLMNIRGFDKIEFLDIPDLSGVTADRTDDHSFMAGIGSSSERER